MAGMRNLGRGYNLVPAASGLGISLKSCSGIGLLSVTTTTAATSLTFTAATSFGGTYNPVTPANGFGQPAFWYQQTAAGTAAWTKQNASWASNVLTIAGTINQVSYVDFLVSQLADLYDYLKVTATNASLTAILFDLTVQRAPENLAIVSA